MLFVCSYCIYYELYIATQKKFTTPFVLSLVFLSFYLHRAKSNPSSTGERGEEEEEDEIEEPVTVNRARSKFSEMMSSNTLSRPSSGNTRFDGGERDDDDNRYVPF